MATSNGSGSLSILLELTLLGDGEHQCQKSIQIDRLMTILMSCKKKSPDPQTGEVIQNRLPTLCSAKVRQWGFRGERKT